ncbi:MAG: hypothetical protein HY917_01220, partial [Candidatus Diapherotrites archaeon]|nr:hypothetical protein [Candidatus Diapherotrites archaeon]
MNRWILVGVLLLLLAAFGVAQESGERGSGDVSDLDEAPLQELSSAGTELTAVDAEAISWESASVSSESETELNTPALARRFGQLVVSVLDADGKPAVKASVAIVRLVRDRKHVVRLHKVNEEGRAFFRLAPGTVWVVAFLKGSGMAK